MSSPRGSFLMTNLCGVKVLSTLGLMAPYAASGVYGPYLSGGIQAGQQRLINQASFPSLPIINLRRTFRTVQHNSPCLGVLDIRQRSIKGGKQRAVGDDTLEHGDGWTGLHYILPLSLRDTNLRRGQLMTMFVLGSLVYVDVLRRKPYKRSSTLSSHLCGFAC